MSRIAATSRAAGITLLSRALGAGWLAWAATAGAAEPVDFRRDVRPVLEQNCFKCHNATKTKGGIDLTEFDSDQSVLKGHKVWERVVDQIQTAQMPPDDEDFRAGDGKTVVAGVTRTLAMLESGHPSLLDPGPALVRRLSHAEYNNAVRDLTGTDLDLAKRVGLPPDSTGSSYENVAAALLVSPALLEKYFTAADVVLDRLFGEVPEAIKKKPAWQSADEVAKLKRQRETFFAALPENADAATARAFVEKFTRLAWRRPLAPAEVDRLMKIHSAAIARGDSPRIAVRRVLKPILVSPDFLFRAEGDGAPAPATAADRVPAVKVTDLELASRLSFFLWSSIPDDELLTLSAQKKLSDPATLAAQVKRMLADPKATALTEHFFLRWLNADHVAQARPSTEVFPAFNDGMRKAMLREVSAFCDNLRTADRPLLDLLDADYTFVNTDLANLYGIAGVTGKETQRVALKPEHHRGGVMAMGAILASTSHTDRTSPSQRGKWVLDVIFGTPPPPPPPNAGQFKDDAKRKKQPKDFREKLAMHATDAACAGCHRRMDPLGFGMDNFDAIGAWRPTSADLDTSGTLPGGEKFDGVDGLKKIVLARREQFTRNLTAQALTYALGRQLEYFDEPQVGKIKAGLDADGGKFSALITGIVNSYPFQHRRATEPVDVAASPVGTKQ